MEEKRGSKRLDISVKVELERIDTENITTVKYVEVDVTNISKTGLAFRVNKKMDIGACFDAKLQIWTKETIDTVFKIVRANQIDDEMYEYGCIFVGMTDTDALKIEIYQLFNDVE